MCFGNQVTSEKKSTPNPAVAAAATGNMDFATALRDRGFTPYTGQQVADISPGQQGTIDAATRIANDGTGTKATNLIDQYSSAPAQSVEASTIASNMSPYMNEYIMRALAPQLRQMDIANADTRARTNAQATSSGAFGDARAGIQASNDEFNANVAREGLIGNAYNQAFNTAIGAGAQDASNKMAADNANAGYMESSLARALGGAGALQALQTQQMGTQTAANSLNQQDTAKAQADLTAQFNQWLMAQQFPFQTAGLVNQSVAAGSGAMPATVTESKPDNSGLAFGGALLSKFI